jgi:Ca2+-binding RTX toxin-like protein
LDGAPYFATFGAVANAKGSATDNAIYGNDLANTLHGLDGNDTLVGALGVGTLWGGAGGDAFVFDNVTEQDFVTESSPGSGVFVWTRGDLVGDFGDTGDRIAVDGSLVGNVDEVLDGVAEATSAAQTFDPAAELILFRQDVGSPFLDPGTGARLPIGATEVDAALANASGALALGLRKIVVVDDGTNSAVFLFQSYDDNATISVDELLLLAVVADQASLSGADIALL